SNYTQHANDGIPSETISLNYGKIKTTYTQQKRSDGAGGGNVSGGWNRINNKVYS
ncbi:type VI secretion system tube protein Hcp, partial [Pseudomonas savastanoi pv. glycinea]